MLQDMALIDFGPFYELGKMIKKKRPKDVYLFQSLTLFICVYQCKVNYSEVVQTIN